MRAVPIKICLSILLTLLVSLSPRVFSYVSDDLGFAPVGERPAATGGYSGPIFTSIGMKFVLIPSGSFMMGSPSSEKGRDSDEKQHRVTLSKGFYMQTTEVTQAQWHEIMGTRPWSGKKYAQERCPDCAASYVSWNDAKEFIKRLNQKEGTNKYRLPTEAEWEYACRAGTTERFCFGNSESRLGDYAWYEYNALNEGERYAHRVAHKRPNAWGLYDMHGNVWEWCEDWYREYPLRSVTDPEGPFGGSHRVRRGGSWHNAPRYVRCANRYDSRPVFSRSFLGFRLVHPVK